MSDRFPDPLFQALTSGGVPISGAKLEFFITGTSTPKNTYSDSAKTTPNTNPVVANSAGRFGAIFMDVDVAYKVVYKDAADVVIATLDPVVPILDNPTARIPVITKATTYNVALADRGKLIEADASTAPFSINLPAAAAATNGFTIRVKKIDATANAVTVDGNGAETIDGALTYPLNAQYNFVDLVTDGTKWDIVGTSQSQTGLIGEATAAGDATVAFTWTQIYKQVRIYWNNVTVSTNGAFLRVRTSANGGISYDAGASDYARMHSLIDMQPTTPALTILAASSDSIVNLGGGIGNTANEFSSGELVLDRPSDAAFTTMRYESTFNLSTDTFWRHSFGGGVRLSATAVNGVQLLLSAGTMSGRFAAYGVP